MGCLDRLDDDRSLPALPRFAALGDVFVGVLVGLVLMPLALGAVYLLGRNGKILGGASGCAAILIAGVVGTVIGLMFLGDLIVPA